MYIGIGFSGWVTWKDDLCGEWEQAVSDEGSSCDTAGVSKELDRFTAISSSSREDSIQNVPSQSDDGA